MDGESRPRGLRFRLLLGAGPLVLCAAFWAIEKALPFSIHKEIAEDQNVGLGIILGAFIIGLSMIISAAIRG